MASCTAAGFVAGEALATTRNMMRRRAVGTARCPRQLASTCIRFTDENTEDKGLIIMYETSLQHCYYNKVELYLSSASCAVVVRREYNGI